MVADRAERLDILPGPVGDREAPAGVPGPVDLGEPRDGLYKVFERQAAMAPHERTPENAAEILARFTPGGGDVLIPMGSKT